jgi:hypothetical protein
MGSALTERDITLSLERFREAGIGGVEVSPIYGPKGQEARSVPFLSERWVDLFAHTLQEAKRLNMGVDLITGTGWPFGGPWVGAADAPCRVWVEALPDGEPLRSLKKPDAELLAAMPAGGKHYALFLAPTGQQVKRAAPGGEGNVLDHFDAGAVRRYLAPFDRAFARLPEGLSPRCFFNDSWEVFGANATPDILEAFARRRGYDLRDHLPHLAGDGDPDTVRRVRADYRLTIEDLTREAFLDVWAGWARGRGVKARNQAHGSPGNLLDLYAAVDIPETEVFGPPRLRLAGLTPLADAPPDFGAQEEALVCRMASSAAHVAGRPLCSSESFTWAGEHAHVPLEHLKAEVDTLFTLGINHIFFHGTPFSPEDAEWPGWMFYASTHCAPTNPWWSHLPALNAYIARCQSLLQAGEPDSDVLLYFPYSDLLAKEAGAHDLLHFLTVGRTATWLGENLPEFVKTAHELAEGGRAFDLVSDRQLSENVTVGEGGRLATTGGLRCRALLVAGCRLAPPETVARWAELARAGATVLVLGELPEDVPGLSDLETRRAKLRAAVAALGAAEGGAGGVRRHAVGRGQVLVGPDLAALLERAGVPAEPVARAGVEFTRRRDGDTLTYFLANPGQEDIRGWFAFGAKGGGALLMDPMTGAVGRAALSAENDGGACRVYLDLPAGASLLLRIGAGLPDADPWPYRVPSDAGEVPLAGPWEVTFVEGGPEPLPAPRRVEALSDWTAWEGDGGAPGNFSGTARYRTTFDAPSTATADGWRLELGTVCHSARVRLNGADIGTVFARPWRLDLPPGALKPGRNELEVEVTNLMANRLADLERRQGARWRPFLMVNIHYKPFDAAKWKPVPSGLLGPVRLLPLRTRRTEI